MSDDPKEIYLQPECCANPIDGRLWCKDDEPEKCEEGVPWTKYIIAWEYERLLADAARLDFLERMFFERKWDGTIGRKCDWYLVGNWRHVANRLKGDTFREAIDAAMKEQK